MVLLLSYPCLILRCSDLVDLGFRPSEREREMVKE